MRRALPGPTRVSRTIVRPQGEQHGAPSPRGVGSREGSREAVRAGVESLLVTARRDETAPLELSEALDHFADAERFAEVAAEGLEERHRLKKVDELRRLTLYDFFGEVPEQRPPFALEPVYGAGAFIVAKASSRTAASWMATGQPPVKS